MLRLTPWPPLYDKSRKEGGDSPGKAAPLDEVGHKNPEKETLVGADKYPPSVCSPLFFAFAKESDCV